MHTHTLYMLWYERQPWMRRHGHVACNTHSTRSREFDVGFASRLSSRLSVHYKPSQRKRVKQTNLGARLCPETRCLAESVVEAQPWGKYVAAYSYHPFIWRGV